MKILGVIIREDTSREGNSIIYIPHKIYDIASYYNYKVILILPNYNQIVLDQCDKVIFPGGDMITDYDLKFMEYCYSKNIPTLGICLGMQAMATVLGGYMYELNSLSHKSKNKYVHEVKINQTSFLYKILKCNTIKVNSRHKDSIKINNKYISSNYNNIVESIEDKKKTFFIGVQWHPEDMFEYDILARRLFDYFFRM